MEDTDLQLIKELGAEVVGGEWVYYQQWARKYPENSKKERYGILPMGAKPEMSNMIYAPGPRELRRKHLQYIKEHGAGIGAQVRKHIDWIEKLEGKQ